MKPNVLLIVLDTARADAFEPYGAPPGASPVIADMARDGGATPHAFAPASWTVPSHVAMFTGRLARSVGLGQAPGGTYHSQRPRMEQLQELLLPSVLREAGYVTVGASCNAWITPTGGWDFGFGEFTHVPSPRSLPKGRLSQQTARWVRELVAARVDDGARHVEQLLASWLRGWDGARPFFWFANLMECHGPYLPPRPYNDLSPVQRVLAGRDSRRYQTFGAVLRQNLTGIEASAASMARMRYLYTRSIRVLDDWLGRVLDLLAAHGVLDDTAVIVTSDHGENFGEGGLIGHAMSLDDRLTRVPMVARGPIDVPVEGPWSLLGLPGLVGAAAGLSSMPYEPWPAGQPAPAQFDPLAPPEDERIVDARRRWSLDDEQVRKLSEPLTTVADGSGKLVRHGDRTWFHDLAADPLELVRAPADRAPVLLQDALANPRLWAEHEEHAEEAVSSAAADGGDADPDEVAALEEQMRLLGYM